MAGPSAAHGGFKQALWQISLPLPKKPNAPELATLPH
jgi:hypothetical protein